jgi:hypothetical protein
VVATQKSRNPVMRVDVLQKRRSLVEEWMEGELGLTANDKAKIKGQRWPQMALQVRDGVRDTSRLFEGPFGSTRRGCSAKGLAWVAFSASAAVFVQQACSRQDMAWATDQGLR